GVLARPPARLTARASTLFRLGLLFRIVFHRPYFEIEEDCGTSGPEMSLHPSRCLVRSPSAQRSNQGVTPEEVEMSRFRVIALSMGMVIALLLAHSVVEAQQPGGGPGGGRGRGGPGGPGGGFGGRGFDTLISLAMRPGVQEELKLTTKQKTDITALN